MLTDPQIISPGEFETEAHFYPRVLNAHIHPLVRNLTDMGNDRILSRFCHLHPEASAEAVKNLLTSVPKYFRWGTAAEEGKPAITVEICDPQRFQRDPIRRTLQGIRIILNHVGMVPTRQHVVKISKPPVLCEKSYWILAQRGGMINVKHRVTEHVQKGEFIAEQINIFGDRICEYTAPEDGIIIGHCVNPIGQTGARIVHLGVPMREQDRKNFVDLSGCSLEIAPHVESESS